MPGGLNERRALNLVWTAAGDYDLRPDFLAFRRDGSPDIYLNYVIGFAYKRFGAATLTELFAELNRSALRDTFSDLLWLGLEAAIYAEEKSKLTGLKKLRRLHAAGYLQDDEDVSMQELMMRRPVAHAIKAARCREILGGTPGLFNPWERGLYAALDYPPGLTTDALIWRTRHILRRFFVWRFTDVLRLSGKHLALSERLKKWLRFFIPKVKGYQDTGPRLLAKETDVESSYLEELKNIFAPKAKLVDIQKRFGAPLLKETNRALISDELCRGNHAGTKLYFAQTPSPRPENIIFFQGQSAYYHRLEQRFIAAMHAALSGLRETLPVAATKGKFLPSRVWRTIYLKDGCVFAAEEMRPATTFTLTLLLDASDSRQGDGAKLAALAYTLTRSFLSLKIPVRVLSYASSGGYTVLTVLKKLSDIHLQGIMAYKPYGWNRDGLALAAAAKLLASDKGKKIILLLTDAHPSDDTPFPQGHGPWRKIYADRAGRADTAAAIKKLNSQGIIVLGLIDGVFPPKETNRFAQEIFGSAWTRTTDLAEMTAKLAQLLRS